MKRNPNGWQGSFYRIALAAVICLSPWFSWGQSFQKTYGAAGNEGANALIATADGNLLMAGYAEEAGTRKALLLKVDPTGNVLFQKTYGEAGRRSEATAVIQTADGGYAFAGYTESVAGGVDSRDIIVTKTNGAGVVAFSTRLDGGLNLYDDTKFGSLIELTNGNFAVCGWTATDAPSSAACSNAGLCWNSYLALLDPGGALLVAKTYPVAGANLDQAFSLTQMASGEIALVGRVLNGADNRGYYMRVNSNTLTVAGGGALAFNGAGASSYEYFTSVLPVSANELYISGAGGASANTANLLALKINNLNGSITAGAFDYDHELTAAACATGANTSIETDALTIPTADGGYAMISSTNALGSNDFYFVKLDAALNPTLSRTLGTAAGVDVGAGLAEFGGGFALAGTTNSFGAGGTDIYLIRFNAAGDLSCNGQEAAACRTPKQGAFQQALFTAGTPTASATVSPTVTDLNLSLDNPCCANFAVTFTAPVVCAGETTTFTITSPNPIVQTEFQWDLNYNGTTFNPTQTTTGNLTTTLPVGTFDVRVVANDLLNGCTDDFVGQVSVNPVPVFTTIPPAATVCLGGTQTLTAAVNLPGAAYSWSPATGLSSANVAAPVLTGTTVGTQTYTITATVGAANCTVTATVAVTTIGAPSVNAGSDQQICTGQTATLNGSGAAGVSFSWTPAGLLSGATNIANPTTVALTANQTYTLTVTDANGCTATDEVLVTVVSAPVTLVDKAYCIGTAGVDLDATVAGGSGCTYIWRVQGNPVILSNAAVFSVAPATTTVYEVTIACGPCQSTNTVTVTPQPLPNVSAGNNVTICNGFSTNLTGTGGVSYVWEPGALAGSTVSVTPATTTIYTVTGTDGNGCSNTSTVTVTVFDLTVPNLGDGDTLCVGESVILNAGGTAQPGETYTWSPNFGFTTSTINDVSPEVNPAVTVTYTLTVLNTLNNCSATNTVKVTVNPLPVAGVIGDGSVCANEVAPYFATGGDSYQWFNDANQLISSSSVAFISATTTTTYSVVATKNGCEGPPTSFTVTSLPVPQPAISVSPLVCAGAPVTVTYTGVRVPNDFPDWNFNGGSAINVGTDAFGPFQVQWPLTGNYTISVVVQAGSCQASASKSVTVRSAPEVSLNSSLYYYCLGNETGPTLIGAVQNADGGPCSYKWEPETGLNNPYSLTPIATPTVTTVYSLTATCQGCSGNPITAEVRVVAPPVATVDSFLVKTCAGKPVQIKGIGAGDGTLNYQWTPTLGLSDANSPTPFANPTTDTQYCLTVTDKNGCKSSPACVLVKIIPLPVANAGPDQVICQGSGQGVYLNGSVMDAAFGSHSYRWTPFDGLNDPFAQNPYANPSQTTIYKLVATNNLTGCSSDSTGLDDVYTVVVRVDEAPIVNAGDPVDICVGATYQMKGEVLGGGLPPYTYLWEPALGLQNPANPTTLATPPHSVTYYLKAKSSLGCESIADSVRINVLAVPTVEATPKVTPTLCPGESVQLKTLVGGVNQNLHYEWSPATGLSDPTAAEPIATPSVTTNYTLVVYNDSDANPNNGKGCASPVPAQVLVQVFPVPTVNANPNNKRYYLCNKTDAPVLLDATITNITQEPYTIDWTPGAGLSDSTILNPTAKPTETTEYVLSVKTATCTVTSSVIVTVLPFVEAKIVASDDTICKGESVTLTAFGGVGDAVYEWRSSISPEILTGKTITVTPEESALYTLRVIEGACQDETDAVVTVLINPRVEFDYTYGEGCRSLTVSFQDKSVFASEWTWDFGDGSPTVNLPNPTHTYLLPGLYTVTLSVKSTDGCLQSGASASQIRVSPAVDADFSSVPSDTAALPIRLYTPIAFKDESVGAVSWLWQFGDGVSSTQQNPTHTYQTAGNHEVILTVTDEKGCTYLVRKTYRVLPPELVIPNVFTPNGDGANDFWRPDYAGSQRFTAKVYDRFGVQLYVGNNDDTGWNGKNGSQELPAGVYFYLVELEGRTYDGSFTLIR